MGTPTHGWGRRWIPALLALMLLAAAIPQPGVARATTLTIPCSDGVGDTAALIAAIAAANTNGKDDVIELASDCSYAVTAVNNTIGGANGLPAIVADGGATLTILGGGATIRRAPEAPPFRLFAIDGGSLTLSELTLSGGLAAGGSGRAREGGRVSGFGGAILNAGSLTLERVTVSGNEARGGDGASRGAEDSGGGGGGGAGLGGAIFNGPSATLTLTNSTLSGNTARGGAGGAGGNNGANLQGGGGGGTGGTGGDAPSTSTQPGLPGAGAPALGGGGGGGGGSNGTAPEPFANGAPRAGAGGAGNFGGGGGGAGASRFGGKGNLGGAGGFGGGAGGESCCSYAAGGGGGAGLGGAIFNNGGSITIASSTVFANLALGGPGGPGSFGSGDGRPGLGLGGAVFTRGGSVGYRSAILAGGGTDDCLAFASGTLATLGHNLLTPAGGCPTNGSTDQVADDLGVQPLADNGGPTFTHALAEISPAIDRGDPGACPATDQRGVSRPQGPACDIGALELEPAVVDLVVTTSADSGPGSLRQAILNASRHAGPDTITFALPTGQLTITLAGPLPPLASSTTVDGLSQISVEPATGPVTIDGSALPGTPDGFVLSGGDTVQGLIITGFGGAGVAAGGTGGNTITGNTITGNAGAGVRVDAGTGNRVTDNSIYANGGLAIDLGGDGVTPNDPGDTDDGPNNLQNVPLLVTTLEGLDSTLISGTLDLPAGATGSVEIYASDRCEPDTLVGDAQTRLGTVAAGDNTFALPVPGTSLGGKWITALVTDGIGNTSELSACAPIRTNDLWTNAIELQGFQPVAGSATTVLSATGQTINHAYQERWYRFPASPGSRVTITLSGQPGSGLTLHRDIKQVYDDLAMPQSAEAQAAQELPAGFLPAGFLPAGFLPAGFLPAGFLPAGFLPAGFLPAGFLPAGFLPAGFLPAGFLPGSPLPAGFLPAGFLPAGFLPELYSGASRDSLMAFAYDPDGTVLTIDRNTWDLAEDLYVRVTGPAGATPFSLSVQIEGGLCANVTAPDPEMYPLIDGPPVPTGTLTSLFIWDSVRFAESDPGADIGALRTRLAGFAGATSGAVIDLATTLDGTPGGPARYPRVAQARATALANPSCVGASNLLADEIKAVIDAYRVKNTLAGGQTSLKYLTIVGDDNSVPFFRYPDQSGLGSENEYYPPVVELSPLNAALRENRVKGQDGYGSTTGIWQGSYWRPVPDLAVGRLVGGADAIEAMLKAYEDVNGLVRPATALVTGYDFVADTAQTVADELGATGVTTTTLIQPVGEGPDGPNAWSADDLRGRLLDAATRDDLVLLTGHFDAGAALAADYESVLFAGEVLQAPDVLSNTIVLGLGCHSGYNLPPDSLIPLFSPDPNFAKAFNARGATYFASTGFAYGDTELAAYGERLMINLAEALTGADELTIGEAAVRAKLDYMARKSSLSGIDEKTLLQFVLYGLPMLRVNMPGTPANTPTGATTSAAPVAGQPGLFQETISVTPELTRTEVPLSSDIGPITATYFTGSAGNVANPAEPIFPLESVDVSEPGRLLRGALFVGATFSDIAGITPLTSAPTTEESRGHPAFFSESSYPTEILAPNFTQAIDGGPTRLLVVPAQYRSSATGSFSGTMRLYDGLQVKLFYLNKADWDSNTGGIRDRALAAAPELVQITSERLSDGAVRFSANVVDDAQVGIAQVNVTYTTPGSGVWQSFDLSRDGGDPTLWTGERSLADMPDDTVYFVQAVNSTGRVSLDNNRGADYVVAPIVPPPPPPTAIATTIQTVSGAFPTGGAYGTRVSFQARLTTDAGLAGGQPMRLSLGGQVAYATTDAAGVGTFALTLSQPPGRYTAQLFFQGAPGLQSSSLSQPFTITKQATRLSIAPAAGASIIEGEPTEISATLKADDGKPIADRTVIFVATQPSGTSYGKAVKTGLDGQAVLSTVPWPVGSYTVRAYFSGSVPGVGIFNDTFYEPSQSGDVSLSIAPVPDTTITSGPPPMIRKHDKVKLTFTGRGGRPPLRFECRLNDAAFAPCTSPVTYYHLKPGQYTFEVRSVDSLGAVDPTPATISWTVKDEELYRAYQQGRQVWITRNITLAGMGDFTGGPIKGWALVGRTNGAADDGELRGFYVEDGIPFAIIFNRSNNKGDRCILVTPRSLDKVAKGQTRLMRTVTDPVLCPANP